MGIHVLAFVSDWPIFAALILIRHQKNSAKIGKARHPLSTVPGEPILDIGSIIFNDAIDTIAQRISSLHSLKFFELEVIFIVSRADHYMGYPLASPMPTSV
jgi:hypothetical protein